MPARHGNCPRTAIVTGADSRIGKARAVALAEVGFETGVTGYDDRNSW